GHIEYIGHSAAVLIKIYTPRSHGGMRDAQAKYLVQGIIFMGEQIPAQSCAVIPPATPAEKAFQAEFVPRGRADKLFPVDGIFIGFGINIINPCAVGVVAVSADFNERYLADNILFYQG